MPSQTHAAVLGVGVLVVLGWALLRAGGSHEPHMALLAGWTTEHPFRWNLRNVAGLFCAIWTAALASSAGVGGGAFFVPIFNLVVGLDLKSATGLSQACIAATSAAAICLNIHKKHPQDASKPLIEYDAILLLAPALLMGVGIGVMLNSIFPDWLITVCLVVLLGYMCQRTLRKGLIGWRTEVHAKHKQQQQLPQQQQQVQQDMPVRPQTTLAQADGAASGPHNGSAVHLSDPEAGATIHASGSRAAAAFQFPYGKLLAVAALWASVAALQTLLKAQPKCSLPFWAVLGSQLAWAIAATLLAAKLLVQPRARRSAYSSGAAAPGSSNGEVMRTLLPHKSGSTNQAHGQGAGAALQHALLSAAAGAAAGLVGLGGGMMMNPLLLHLGAHPLIGAATSNVLVFISSSSATVSYVLEGRLLGSFAAVFSGASFAASVAGLTVIGALVKRSGPSLIVLVLSFIMGLGALLSGVFGGLNAWQDWAAGADMGFQRLCSS